MYARRIAHLTPAQVAPFRRIVDVVWAEQRGRRVAAEILGVSETVLRNIKGKELLTDKQARVILANYKKWKAENA